MRGSSGRPWFTHKRYGYGASVPITWEGWVVVALFFVGLFGEMGFTLGWLRVIALTVIVCAFIAVCALKTEGGMRWRWGDED
jgi:amino acid permease